MEDSVLKAVAKRLWSTPGIDSEVEEEWIPLVEQALRDMCLGELLAAGEIKQHRYCEDAWYSCPKNDEYIGNEDRNICDCGKDAWDAAKAKVLS